ncbi:ABC-three component system protein [Burkholderia sp. BCC0419]|uniref:ABC-three component system protein n=1 Tax=Burkholderia sp. BCC0419 TaxID=486878 RepID=UPI00158955E9|nr:ABC-three component system protein [Burkholderia sp. BCC0419]
MAESSTDQYSAGEQGLGYIYQPRFALLKLLQLPESTSVLIEKDDDLDFIDTNGTKTLASLKHKGVDDRLTDLSTDFWKSVRIWLARYNRDGRSEANLRFFLFSTGTVSNTSFLRRFLLEPPPENEEAASLSQIAADVLAKSESKLIGEIAAEFHKLNDAEKDDFLSRIVIFDGGPRIQDVPSIIKDQHMRSIRRDNRDAIFERLEGWWNDTIVNLLVGKRTDAIFGYEISDKLSAFAEEYKSDNLPITFSGKVPAGEIDADNDPRLFVVQLREIGIASNRIRNAILDYYRAFEQRSSWARESLLISGEMEEYEDRLVDEWSRYRDVVFEELDEESADAVLLEAGKALYRWVDLESGNSSTLRIRERVTEPYVVRGGFHILANNRPLPRVYWHPRFLDRVGQLLGVAA